MNPRAVGIDAGSTTFKAVLIELGPTGVKILDRFLEEADPDLERQTARALAQLGRQGAERLGPLGATGYGRKRVPGADRVLTEITCHARGVAQLLRPPAALLEVGGQDSKFIRLGHGGEVEEFRMNDRCAAGTGRFLEVTLRRLRVPYEELPQRLRQATRSVRISSLCAVFAETEVISLVGRGEPVEVILRGLHDALAERLATLVGPLPASLPLWLAGGVALNGGMVDALSRQLSRPVEVVPDPQLSGALGAALSVR